jgi:2-iminobutanoate/2-iminopropanoate deaminase
MMRTTKISLIAMLSLAALLSAATSQSQTVSTTYEKKSYNYAEWAKGRFSEVVTVRNAGKIIYLGGVGAEDENSDQGGVIRHLGDFGSQCRYAWEKIKRLLEKHDATVENVDKVVTYVTDIRYFFEAGKCRAEAYAGVDATCWHVSSGDCPRLARNAHRGRRDCEHAEVGGSAFYSREGSAPCADAACSSTPA